MAGQVIAFSKPEHLIGAREVYVYGETILVNANGREFKDADGAAIRQGEYYRVTPEGITRIP